MTHLISSIDFVYELLIDFSTTLCSRVSSQFQMHTADVVHREKIDDTVSDESLPTQIDVVQEEQTFKPIANLLKADAFGVAIADKNTVMYAGNVSVPLYANPTVEFDTQIAQIPYGELVMMLEPHGRFLKVQWGTFEGWVLKGDLVDRAARIYPEFVVGQENLVDQVNTTHVRAILGDTFGLNRSEFSLQAGEYVLYRLWRKGIRIAWPPFRPRTPGLWHKILKGVPSVHVGVIPKVGSIMEYLLPHEVGHLAYVEAVFPDTTIALSEVNFSDSGIYNERELTKEEWKELKPVFISIT